MIKLSSTPDSRPKTATNQVHLEVLTNYELLPLAVLPCSQVVCLDLPSLALSTSSPSTLVSVYLTSKYQRRLSKVRMLQAWQSKSDNMKSKISLRQRPSHRHSLQCYASLLLSPSYFNEPQDLAPGLSLLSAMLTCHIVEPPRHLGLWQF